MDPHDPVTWKQEYANQYRTTDTYRDNPVMGEARLYAYDCLRRQRQRFKQTYLWIIILICVSCYYERSGAPQVAV